MRGDPSHPANAGNLCTKGSTLHLTASAPVTRMTRLLRPFERLDTARGNEGGSGLGLAIADRIAKLHRGNLALLNRPQGGLEARLTLPI